MKSFFDTVTRISIRFRWITIAVTVALMALGVYAALGLTIELLPPIDIPSTYVLARSHGSTNGDVMLQAHTIPIEDGASTIDGVVNRESNTSNGFAFLEIRNEYGLDQNRIREDLRDVLQGLDLPLRRITPPGDSDPGSMISDLTPDVMLYLYAYSLEEDTGFLPQLDPDVWQHISPDVTNALPDAAFDDLDPMLARDLRANRSGQPQPVPDLDHTPAPALPTTWQMDRFETAQDLIELTGIRNLADVFNDFLNDGYIQGPLGTTADLTPNALATLVAIEARCHEHAANSADGELSTEDCFLFSYLDGEALAALLTAYDAGPDGQLTDMLALPSGLFAHLEQEDRSQIATTLIAQALSGMAVNREVPLPDELRWDAPRLITFSFSDIPLAVLSVNADISRDELQRLVENEIVPRLEALDEVADVSVQGGEEIRADLLNDALMAEGLDDQMVDDELSTPLGSETPDTSESTASPQTNGDTADAALPEGPPLPAIWAVFATQLPDVDELDTADDLLRIPGMAPSAVFNQAVTMAADDATIAQFVGQALSGLSPEVLDYLAEHEEGFYTNLSYEVIKLLSAETLSALPETVQSRATAGPALGESWQRLSAEPELAATPLMTADDLIAFDGGAAETLNQLVLSTPAELQFYVIQLVNDLTPGAVSFLVSEDDSFANTLDQQTLCYFPADVLTLPDVEARWSDQDWQCQWPDGSTVALADIADGSASSAAGSLIGTQAAERIFDPDAPALPSSWPGIAGFVGARELDTADDLFYTVENGETLSPSRRLNAFTRPDGQRYARELTADVLLYIADCDQGLLCEEGFFDNLSDRLLTLFSDEVAALLPDSVQARRNASLLGTYVPESIVTRTDGKNSLILNIRKAGDANTVTAWAEAYKVLRDLEDKHPEIDFTVTFEQASYIEESISGVAREGGLGAVMAVIVILIFLNFSVRSTLVTAVSIPTSVALAFVLMRWLPGNVHDVLFPLSENASGTSKGLIDFFLRLFPENISLNIMTLSGLTVAIGRVVDDAIVVLENIYRNIQHGEDRLEAVLHGTRDVSVAIFAATVTTVIVFLPIGLFGGIIGAFFLPFGLAVTYALMASFVVAITVVPLFAYLFIDKESLPEEHRSRLESGYRRVIRWVLEHRWVVMGAATGAFALGVLILSQLPTAFLPDFGEPTITIDVNLPGEIDGSPTTIAVTDVKVRRLEQYLHSLEGIEAVQTSVGGGGQNGLTASDTISENEAVITVSVASQEELERLTPLVRAQSELIFNDLDRDGEIDAEQDNVTVSGASLSEQGFGGFAVVVSGTANNPPTLAELNQYDELIVNRLDTIEGITNIESSLAQVTSTAGDVSQTYIRIDGIPAARYTAELETDDTLGLTREAIEAVQALDLPDNLTVGEGFESQQQTEGFQQTFISMGIAVAIVYVVMVLTFGSLVHPVTILFSLPLAVVGAAIGLDVTGRVLGLSSVVGLLMLVGIVVTNAIVLIDLVQTNRKTGGMSTKTALVEGGATRLRPILMTAIATMVALLPLAIGLSEGAIIAAELGTVVIGGLFSSTLLTLVVVPVVFSLFDSAQTAVKQRIKR